MMFEEKRSITKVRIGKVDYIISSTDSEEYVINVARLLYHLILHFATIFFRQISSNFDK